MNKTLKKVLIGAGASVGLIMLLMLVYLLVVKIELNKMSALDTGEIKKGIYAINDDFVNMYLIESNGKYIAIDAGNKIEHIEQELKNINVERQNVIAVFLTHSDYDHVSTTKLFKNAKIFLPRAEEQMVNGQTNRFAMFGNSLDFEYQLVDDNQIVTIFDQNILCILTPGHTPGSMSYLVDNKYLFTGDSMSLKDGVADQFNELFNMDSVTQQISLKKLAALKGVQNIFTAHYGASDNHSEAFDNLK